MKSQKGIQAAQMVIGVAGTVLGTAFAYNNIKRIDRTASYQEKVSATDEANEK